MTAAISREAFSLPIPLEMKDMLRAKILKQMMMEIAHQTRQREGI